MNTRALRIFLAAGTAVLWFLAAAGQENKSPRTYTVGGMRHGVSFFPRVDYEATRPKVKGRMDFAHYHIYDEVVEFLRKWAKDYPDLVSLYSVGKSFEGRDIWQITITNKSTGPDTDKPGFFIERNRHSGEVTAAESALYFAWSILTHYGRDPETTRLVDQSALYVKVKNNPDGSDLYLLTAQSNRSTVRPHDDDGDGLLDEDPPEDLDDDGLILQMRQKVEDGKGDFIIDPEDRSGRLMKRVGPGKGNYKIFSEGIDNDGDGRVTDLETLRWLDENLPGEYFKPWTKFQHPQLGEVEIGGFNPKFFRQNPPPEILEEWVAKEARFNLLLARSLPHVRVVSLESRPVREEPGCYEIVGVFTNDGFLPTALEMAKRVKIVRPDAAVLRLTGKGAELAKETLARQEIGFLKPGERKEVRWKVKAAGAAPRWATFLVS
jgi:hypothetical protein